MPARLLAEVAAKNKAFAGASAKVDAAKLAHQNLEQMAEVRRMDEHRISAHQQAHLVHAEDQIRISACMAILEQVKRSKRCCSRKRQCPSDTQFCRRRSMRKLKRQPGEV